MNLNYDNQCQCGDGPGSHRDGWPRRVRGIQRPRPGDSENDSEIPVPAQPRGPRRRAATNLKGPVSPTPRRPDSDSEA